MLAEALLEFEETAHCPGCGQLTSKAWDEASDGAWEVVSDIKCHACAVRENDKGEHEPGTLRFLSVDDKAVKIARARMKARAQG